jgi:hypothetical protein
MSLRRTSATQPEHHCISDSIKDGCAQRRLGTTSHIASRSRTPPSRTLFGPQTRHARPRLHTFPGDVALAMKPG